MHEERIERREDFLLNNRCPRSTPRRCRYVIVVVGMLESLRFQPSFAPRPISPELEKGITARDVQANRGIWNEFAVCAKRARSLGPEIGLAVKCRTSLNTSVGKSHVRELVRSCAEVCEERSDEQKVGSDLWSAICCWSAASPRISYSVWLAITTSTPLSSPFVWKARQVSIFST